VSTDDSDHSLASKSAVAQEAPELPQGSKIDRYVVLEVLGKGGMGVVYKAYDPRLNRGVALKLIRARQDDQGSCGSARLLREAQALAQLTHPNVVAVHDVGTVEDNVFVAMELVPGKTLRAWHKATTPSTTGVLQVMRAAGWGLAAAHKAGLIHRDFKPDNVIVGEDGRVRVLDLGLVCSAAEASWATPDLPLAADADTVVGTDKLGLPLTRTGVRLGTPIYMAREQHLGGAVDARADQFAFCVSLYLAVYGERPFAGDTYEDLLTEVCAGKVKPEPKGSSVPLWLRRALLRGLSTKAEQRYPSMETLLEELRQDPEEARRQKAAARRRKLLVIGSVVLAVCVPICLGGGQRYLEDRTRRAFCAPPQEAS
jgi:serine/threonine protein kinase